MKRGNAITFYVFGMSPFSKISLAFHLLQDAIMDIHRLSSAVRQKSSGAIYNKSTPTEVSMP